MNIVKTDIWSYLSNSNKPILIYGMGNGADKIINEFSRLNINIYGIMASDDFVRGQSFHEFKVKKLSDFEREVHEPVIILSFGTQRQEVMDNIFHLAKKHTVLAADVPVYGENIFNTDFYNAHQQEIEMLCHILADDHSRKVLENEINFKLTGQLDYLTEIFTDKKEAFQILDLQGNESYLDLGAYRGDTIQEFLHYTNGQYSHITALEPDRKTYKKLRAYAGQFPDTQLWNMGIWDCDSNLYFNASLGRGSSIQTAGSQELAVTKIDTLYKVRHVSYIKMDVEGAERQALLGGAVTLQRDKPKINMALYHRSEDIFALPLLLHEIQPKYKIYFRQHPHIPAWDFNLYAI